MPDRLRDRQTAAADCTTHSSRLINAVLTAAILVIGAAPYSATAQAPTNDSRSGSPDSQPDSPPAIPPIIERIVVTAPPLEAGYELRQGVEFEETLFSRDDQILHLLNAGINAGQHEGGGKSLEIRRYGFNLDHGGVSGGLKVLVDNVSQNYATQGHGQGYLGSLKSISPELVEDVTVLDGPFQAEYGDFSGLGVVQIHLRESMPQRLTTRMQAGSFDTYRGFVSFSPNVRNRDAVFAYEGSSTNGPFLKPLDYRRDNVTGNYTWHLENERRFSLKWNGGRNGFRSSGQLPLDEVAAGRLSRFGSLSDGDGGRVQAGRLGAYWNRNLAHGGVWKLNGFVERSLFDLYSNFTYYLVDPERGDAIQQHDSRLIEGGNTQYSRPHFWRGAPGLFTAGGDLHAFQTNVGLSQAIDRDPVTALTATNAAVTNGGGYLHENMTVANGRVQLGAGLRWDLFRFTVSDRIEPGFGGSHAAAKLQPKAGLSYLPSTRFPIKFYFNYGRGITSLDARGIVRDPAGRHLATTDFYQFGTTHQIRDRLTLTSAVFRIDMSNQSVYIPDDGSIEFAGPSRSYGYQGRIRWSVTRRFAFHGGVTKVLNAYYRGTQPREYVNSAPHFVADASVSLSGWRSWSGSLRMRAINRYRLDRLDPAIAASGHTIFDFALAKRLPHGLEFNLAVDNLLDRNYFETQNFFTSRLPGQPAIERIHATPGYGRTITAGLTFRFGGK